MNDILLENQLLHIKNAFPVEKLTRELVDLLYSNGLLKIKLYWENSKKLWKTSQLIGISAMFENLKDRYIINDNNA